MGSGAPGVTAVALTGDSGSVSRLLMEARVIVPYTCRLGRKPQSVPTRKSGPRNLKTPQWSAVRRTGLASRCGSTLRAAT